MNKLAAYLLLLCVLSACGEDDDPVAAGSSNRSPVVQEQPDMTMAYGDTLRLTASATDPDGDEVTYSLAVIASLSEIRTGYFARASIDPVTGEYWFYPSTRDIPSRSFQFIAEDSHGNSANTQFKVFVQQ